MRPAGNHRAQPLRAAHHKRDLACALILLLFEPASEAGRGLLSAFFIKDNQTALLRQMSRKLFSFGFDKPGPAQRPPLRRIARLHDLASDHPADSLQVIQYKGLYE